MNQASRCTQINVSKNKTNKIGISHAMNHTSEGNGGDLRQNQFKNHSYISFCLHIYCRYECFFVCDFELYIFAYPCV